MYTQVFNRRGVEKTIGRPAGSFAIFLNYLWTGQRRFYRRQTDADNVKLHLCPRLCAAPALSLSQLT